MIVEIGGNDLLGSTTNEQFRQDLDALLGYLSAPGRQILMFELPLPPFRIEFGRIQRIMARKYDVNLVPKTHLLSVLANRNATVDSVHLTQSGHRRMAGRVWMLVRAAFDGENAP